VAQLEIGEIFWPLRINVWRHDERASGTRPTAQRPRRDVSRLTVAACGRGFIRPQFET
jgi:hypothetical protein